MDAYKRVSPEFDLTIAGAPVRGDVPISPDPRINFCGWVVGEELDRLYDSASAVIIPSRWEGFGLVALEAMARGKAVIASNVGGLKYVVKDGMTGVLFDTKNMDETLQYLSIVSEESLREMGSNGRDRYLASFTGRKMNEAILDAYIALGSGVEDVVMGSTAGSLDVANSQVFEEATLSS